MKRDGWALQTNSGRIVPETFSTKKDEAWTRSFNYLSKYEWMMAYYKQWDASIAAAKKRGYSLIRIELIESF